MTMIETSRAAPAPFRARAEALRDGREPPALPGGNSFQRILTAKAVAAVTHRQTADVAARLWPSDKVMAQLMTRAVPATAMTSVAGWAAELAHKVVIDALEGMGPASAGARMLLHALVLMFDGNGLISAPGFVAGAGNAGFVAEGQPIPKAAPTRRPTTSCARASSSASSNRRWAAMRPTMSNGRSPSPV
jgi:hypothetical protein